MDTDTFFLHEPDRTTTLADWLSEAVSGRLFSPGTELLEQYRILLKKPAAEYRSRSLISVL